MLRNYFKLGLRNILKNKGFYFLNTLSLVVGLVAVLLIGLWVAFEFNFNKSIKDYPRIARVMQNQTFAGKVETGPSAPLQLSPILQTEFSDQFEHTATSTFPNDMDLSYDERKIVSIGVFAQPSLPYILNVDMLSGQKEALEDPSSIIISESVANTLFGNQNPVGKILKLGSSMQLSVRGVYKDFAKDTDFANYKFIGSWEYLKDVQDYENRLGWGNNWFQVLAKIKKGKSFDKISQLIKNVKQDNYEEAAKAEFFLFPLGDWHLYSEFENGRSVGGNIQYVKIFGTVGLFILFLACINYMNLSTARALKRSKEVGIRKTLGSSRKQLIIQFFSESFILIVFSFFVALFVVMLVLPDFNNLTQKSIAIQFSSTSFWLISFALIGITALLSSAYPAFYLSAFKPVKVLKGLTSSGKNTVNIRKSLVVVQFAISIILIIGTLTVLKQINHVKDRPVNYDKELMVAVPIKSKKIIDEFSSLRTELLKSPYIEEVAASDVTITNTATTNGGFEWKGKDPNFDDSFYTLRSTQGFGEMIDWEIVDGRDFSSNYKSDSLSFIVNETAVKYMNLDNPLGEQIRWGNNGTYTIVGVVKDMVTRSPFDPMVPSIFVLHYGGFLSNVNIKLSGNDSVDKALAGIETVFNRYSPETTFTYNFLDEEYERKFAGAERIASLTSIFSIVAILISCLGVLGLSTFMAIQRKKEIGIRKVLGASVASIWGLLSKQFLILVLIAFGIAIPLGYYYSTNWLEGYAYRTSLDIWTMVIAAVIILGITFVTVSFQSIKAAISNPIKSLRTE